MTIAGAITVFVMYYIKKIYFPAFADCVVPGLMYTARCELIFK